MFRRCKRSGKVCIKKCSGGCHNWGNRFDVRVLSLLLWRDDCSSKIKRFKQRTVSSKHW